jgi:hypothetical protein
MRTLLLLLSTVLTTLGATAQVTLDVLEPASIQGSYEHTWAAPGSGSWNTPDMSVVTNRLIAPLTLAMDGSAADSLCCTSISASVQLTGKIAVLYRGTCDYSVKALHCQNAGAVAVIIINNIPGAPATMGAGSQGQLVTIPVFQVTDSDGALIRATLDAQETVTALLGNKRGYYAQDLGLTSAGTLLAPSSALPSFLAADEGDCIVELAAWVQNYGEATRTDIALRATVTQNGSTFYDHTSAPFDIAAGDSAFVTLQDYLPSGANGRHTITYSIVSPDNDDYTADNSMALHMVFDSLYALSPLDTVTGIPTTTIGIQPASPTGEYESCIHFRSSHADRVAVTGLQLYAAKNEPGTVQNELITIRAYEWFDVFAGLTDPGFTITSLLELGSTDHFLTEPGNETEVYLPFEAPIEMLNDARYLFCVSTFNPDIFLGFNRNVKYNTHQEVYDQPTSPIRNGSSWFVGFNDGPISSIGVRMIDVTTIGIREHSNSTLALYPNPGNGPFQLTMDELGPCTISVSDAAGRVVFQRNANGPIFQLDLAGEKPGLYLVRVEHAKGVSIGRVVLQ